MDHQPVGVPVMDYPMKLEPVFQQHALIALAQRQKIPRPPNAFMLFANEWRKKFAARFSQDSNKEISVKLGIKWKTLDPVEKQHYFALARQADLQHKIKFPNYVYNPKEARMRKALREQTRETRAQITRAINRERQQYRQGQAIIYPIGSQTGMQSSKKDPSETTLKRPEQKKRLLSNQSFIVGEEPDIAALLQNFGQQEGPRVIVAPAFADSYLDIDPASFHQTAPLSNDEDIVIADLDGPNWFPCSFSSGSQQQPLMMENVVGVNQFGHIMGIPGMGIPTVSSASSFREMNMQNFYTLSGVAPSSNNILILENMSPNQGRMEFPTTDNTSGPNTGTSSTNKCLDVEGKSLNHSLHDLSPYELTQQMLSAKQETATTKLETIDNLRMPTYKGEDDIRCKPHGSQTCVLGVDKFQLGAYPKSNYFFQTKSTSTKSAFDTSTNGEKSYYSDTNWNPIFTPTYNLSDVIHNRVPILPSFDNAFGPIRSLNFSNQGVFGLTNEIGEDLPGFNPGSRDTFGSVMDSGPFGDESSFIGNFPREDRNIFPNYVPPRLPTYPERDAVDPTDDPGWEESNNYGSLPYQKQENENINVPKVDEILPPQEEIKDPVNLNQSCQHGSNILDTKTNTILFSNGPPLILRRSFYKKQELEKKLYKIVSPDKDSMALLSGKSKAEDLTKDTRNTITEVLNKISKKELGAEYDQESHVNFTNDDNVKEEPLSFDCFDTKIQTSQVRTTPQLAKKEEPLSFDCSDTKIQTSQVRTTSQLANKEEPLSFDCSDTKIQTSQVRTTSQLANKEEPLSFDCSDTKIQTSQVRTTPQLVKKEEPLSFDCSDTKIQTSQVRTTSQLANKEEPLSFDCSDTKIQTSQVKTTPQLVNKEPNVDTAYLQSVSTPCKMTMHLKTKSEQKATLIDDSKLSYVSGPMVKIIKLNDTYKVIKNEPNKEHCVGSSTQEVACAPKRHPQSSHVRGPKLGDKHTFLNEAPEPLTSWEGRPSLLKRYFESQRFDSGFSRDEPGSSISSDNLEPRTKISKVKGGVQKDEWVSPEMTDQESRSIPPYSSADLDPLHKRKPGQGSSTKVTRKTPLHPP